MSMCSTSRQPRELCSSRISGSCCEMRAVSSAEQHELLWYQLQFTAYMRWVCGSWACSGCMVCGVRHACTRELVHACVCACVCACVPACGMPAFAASGAGTGRPVQKF